MLGVFFSHFDKSFFSAIHKIMAASAMNMNVYKSGRNIFALCVYFDISVICIR
jgi:ribosome recycling factor